jgi:hypothetical protein
MSIDFNVIKPEHEDIHQRLENWGKWCKGSTHGNVHPMFRQYRNGYFEASPARSTSDTVDAVAIQKAMKDIPEPQRIAIQWFYVKPGSPNKVCFALGVNKRDLLELIHQGRTMMKNVSKVKEMA